MSNSPEALHADLSWQEPQSSFLSTYLTQDAEIGDLQQLDTLRQKATLVIGSIIN